MSTNLIYLAHIFSSIIEEFERWEACRQTLIVELPG